MLKKLLFISGIAALLSLAGLAYASSSFPVGGQTYYLSGAGINATQNTIQLSSFTTADGRAITMTNFGTVGYGALEPQTSSKIEDVSFTGVTQNSNGTATLTGVTRGVDFLYPYASTVTLQKSHSGGAQFIITNTPEWYYNEFAMPNLSNVNTYPTASTSVATKGYVDQVAFSGSGAVAATQIALGYVQLATQSQAAASTPLAGGSTGASLALTTNLATSTYNAATASQRIIVSSSTGFIDPGFISLATTTLIGSTQAFNIGKTEVVATSSTTFVLPSGITRFYVKLCGAGGDNGSSGAAGGGGAGGCAEGMVSTTTNVTLTIGAGVTSGTAGTTSFGGAITCTGGVTGSLNSNVAGGSSAAGGVGGTCTGPSLQTASTGQSGASGIYGNSGAINANGQGGFSLLGVYGSGSSGSGGTGSQPGEIEIFY